MYEFSKPQLACPLGDKTIVLPRKLATGSTQLPFWLLIEIVFE